MNEVVIPSASLVAQLAADWGTDPAGLKTLLIETCFRINYPQAPLNNEELMRLLRLCHRYRLNPFLGEICARRSSTGLVIPSVSLDGWLKILNSFSDYNGMEVSMSEREVRIDGVPVPEWCEVTIYRRSIDHPVAHREYAVECVTEDPAWKQHPRRMLKRRTTVQAARYAFGVSVGFFEISEDPELIPLAAEVEQCEENCLFEPPLRDEVELGALLEKALENKLCNPSWDVFDWMEKRLHAQNLEFAKAWLTDQLRIGDDGTLGDDSDDGKSDDESDEDSSDIVVIDDEDEEELDTYGVTLPGV